MTINYKFDEPEILEELKQYIDKTYNSHYTHGNSNEIQTFELISKKPLRGKYFAIGSIQKYSDRCEDKNQEEKDIFKIIHFGMLALYSYRKQIKQEKIKKEPLENEVK